MDCSDIFKHYNKEDSNIAILCTNLFLEGTARKPFTTNPNDWLALHLLNVAKYSLLICKEIGSFYKSLDFPHDNQESNEDFFYSSGLVHDIGKIFRDDLSIHYKLGTVDEILKLKDEHVKEGNRIINERMKIYNNGIPKALPYIALSHHENFGGNGYPNGCNDLSHPLQIIKLADIYDTKTSERPYLLMKGFLPKKENTAKDWIYEEFVNCINPLIMECFMEINFSKHKVDYFRRVT